MSREAAKTWLPGTISHRFHFDAVGVHGDIRLADEVLDYAFEIGRESSQFIKLTSINACMNSPPPGFFGPSSWITVAWI